MRIEASEITLSTRHAGRVSRYHTWPVLRQQTVGEHSWQVLRLYVEIFGAPPPEVTKWIVYHDVPEIKNGDPPFPVKRDNPALGVEYAKIDHEFYQTVLGHDPSSDVSPEDRLRVKLCDLMEMYEFGVEETQMGNRFAEPIVDRVWAAILSLLQRVDHDDEKKFLRYAYRERVNGHE